STSEGAPAGRRGPGPARGWTLPLALDHKPIRFLFLPEGEDPDTYIRQHGKEAFERCIAESQLLSEFLLAELRAQSDTRSAEGRARFLVEAKPHLQKITAPS